MNCGDIEGPVVGSSGDIGGDNNIPVRMNQSGLFISPTEATRAVQSNLLLKRIQHLCDPITTVVGGVLTWRTQPGKIVAHYDTIATIYTGFDEVLVTSTCAGKLRVLMVRSGTHVTPGTVLCYVEPHGQSRHPAAHDKALPTQDNGSLPPPLASPTSSASDASNRDLYVPVNGSRGAIQVPTNVPVSVPLNQNGAAAPSRPTAQALCENESPVPALVPGPSRTRRGQTRATPGDVPDDGPIIVPAKGAIEVPAEVPAGLDIFAALPGVLATLMAGRIAESSPPPKQLASPVAPGREATRHRAYHVTESQEDDLRRLTQQLRAELKREFRPPLNESEMVRCAIELLLALPRPALLAALHQNRAKERVRRYGSGWPRPGRK